MKRFFIIGLLLTGLLFSCNKDEGNNKDLELKKDAQEENKETCLEMEYPLTFIMPDGSTITGDSKKEIGTAMKSWYEANPGFEERPTMQFPVEVKFKGKPMTINNDEEMKKLKKACAEEKERCYTMIFPLTFIMPDGSTITGNDRKEIGLAIKSWFNENPGIEERPAMQFPVEVKFKGRILTVNDEEGMQRIKKACEGDKERCFVFIFPITYIMPDETTITINNEDDRENRMAIRAWYGENPGIEEKPDLQYPLDVKLKDGTVVTVSSDEDMREVREGCK